MAFVLDRFRQNPRIKLSNKQVILIILLLIVAMCSRFQIVKVHNDKSDDAAKHENYYQVLKLDPSSAKEYTSNDIKKAYRKLAVSYFPDKMPQGVGQEFFERIQEAAEVLRDEELRRIYDDEGYVVMKKTREKRMEDMKKETETKGFQFKFGNQ